MELNGSRPKVTPSAGAILLAVALLAANAAWCESDPPLAPVTIASFEEGYSQSVLVRETKVGIWYALAAGVRMALTRESFNSIWPSYAYKIDPASNDLDRTCQLLEHGMPEHFADDATILMSQVELGAQASAEFKGYELKALDVCSSGAEIGNYLLTETPVQSQLLSQEPDARVWLEKSGIYNYLVTENPVPSLELGARVWLEKSS